MKYRFLILLFFVITGYSATLTQKFTTFITILPQINILEIKGLTPPPQPAGSNLDLLIPANSSYAANFNLSGSADSSFNVSIIPSSIIIKTGNGNASNKKITVTNFTHYGPTSFDSNGNANGLKIGATFQIRTEDIVGLYSGSVTLRIIY